MPIDSQLLLEPQSLNREGKFSFATSLNLKLIINTHSFVECLPTSWLDIWLTAILYRSFSLIKFLKGS